MVRKISLELPKGDITERERQLHARVVPLYKRYRETEANFSPRVRARTLLSFVRVFLELNMDEVANMLMIEIDEVCPNYFDGPCKEDMADPKFEKICLKIADLYDKFFKGK